MRKAENLTKPIVSALFNKDNQKSLPRGYTWSHRWYCRCLYSKSKITGPGGYGGSDQESVGAGSSERERRTIDLFCNATT